MPRRNTGRKEKIGPVDKMGIKWRSFSRKGDGLRTGRIRRCSRSGRGGGKLRGWPPDDLCFCTESSFCSSEVGKQVHERRPWGAHGCRHCEELQVEGVTGHRRGAAWRGFGYQQARSLGSPGGSVGKESAFKAGDWGSIPGSGRSPGGGHGHPLQHSCLENPMDRGAWRAAVHGAPRVGQDRND